MKVEWWKMKVEWWRMMISSCWGVLNNFCFLLKFEFSNIAWPYDSHSQLCTSIHTFLIILSLVSSVFIIMRKWSDTHPSALEKSEANDWISTFSCKLSLPRNLFSITHFWESQSTVTFQYCVFNTLYSFPILSSN